MKVAKILSIFAIAFTAVVSQPQPQNPQSRNYTNAEVTTILNSISGLPRYDRRLRPDRSGPPTIVNVTMNILSISSVTEIGMEFTATFYLQQSWNDDRLSFNHQYIKFITVGTDVLRRDLWMPDTFFVNEKEGHMHRATVNNELVTIAGNGSVYSSIRVTVTSHCEMHLVLYPFDTQACTLRAESYRYRVDELAYVWGREGWDYPVYIHNFTLPQFRVLGYRVGTDGSDDNGGYPSVTCTIVLTRSMIYFVIRVFVPCSLIVVISWLPLWIDRNARLERLAIGISTVLALSTFISSIDDDLPKISYLTAIDVYLFASFMMVFGAVVENALTGALPRLKPSPPRPTSSLNRKLKLAWKWKRISRNVKIRRTPSVTPSDSVNSENAHEIGPPHELEMKEDLRVRIRKMFRPSRFLFPAAYLCFHVIYVSVYLSASAISLRNNSLGLLKSGSKDVHV